MKLIDKLVKLTNKEEIKPFKIGGDDSTIYFEKNGYLYQKYGGSEDVVDWSIYEEWLNYEVEIIEEKKIENLPFDNNMKLTMMEVYYQLEKYNYKINEIIDKLNEVNHE